MSPLHLWALFGAAAGAALPVLIHVLTRPRGERRLLPTFRFLVETAQHTARRNRLRNFLVLLARALALLLLGLGFARFMQRAPEAAREPGERKGRKVVILDCSLSMKATEGGVALFDRARAAAQKVFDEPGTAEGELVLAAENARAVFGKTSPNLVALKDEIAKALARPERLRAAAALEAAARSLAGLGEAELAACEVVVVSDLQRGNWAKASFAPLPKGVPVRILSVGRDGLPNLCLAKAGISGLPEAGARFFAVADVVNYGRESAEVRVELAFDERAWSSTLQVPAGEVKSLSFELADVPAGWRAGRFRLVPAVPAADALPDDDVYPLCVRVQPAREIALVTLERPGEVGGPAYFLQRALESSPEATVGVARYLPGQLEGELDEALWNAELVAVVNAGLFSEAQAAALGRLLVAGIPVLFAPQGAVDADNVKILEAQLGAALRLPVEFQPYRGAGRASALGSVFAERAGHDDRGARFLVFADPERRPFRVFGDAVTRFTATLKLGGGLASRPRDGAGLELDAVRARYNDESAALIVTQVAAGRFGLLNMALGGDERRFAAHPIFVPLIQELCAELLDSDSQHNKEAGRCGQTVHVPVGRWTRGRARGAQDTQAWTLRGPDGQPVPLTGGDFPSLKDDAAGAALFWASAGRPGPYALDLDGEPAVRFTLVPPFDEEGDLSVLGKDVLEQRLAQDRTVSVVEAEIEEDSSRQDREHSDAFFLAALGCLFLELLFLKAFRT
ncbi:MAG: BatA domain-containing protein [Planctomycetota bacterium]|nr:BatA domain-containing protein [Planctomycetota bacterium]